jgi:hypothetical protein
MVDIRTLIFSMALGNLAFALLVWIYSRSSNQKNPYLSLWQLAKVVAGCGYLLGWLRPLLQRGVARLSNFFDSCLTQDRVYSRNYTLCQRVMESAPGGGSLFVVELACAPASASQMQEMARN